MTENYVNLPPSGVVIALGYWPGDVEAAMRLARLIGSIEVKRRADVAFAFCPRFDLEQTAQQWETFLHVAKRFPSMWLKQRGEGVGHPDGSWNLWSSTVGQLSEGWWAGRLSSHSVFTIESDGCPLRADWIDVLLAEHRATVAAGKRITGAMTNHSLPHINGSLWLHFSAWIDRPSIRATPSGQAWDLFHAAVLTAEARPTTWIKNCYGAGNWSPESLTVMSKETAWLSSCKDLSVVAWAERTLVDRPAKLDPYRPEARVHEHFGPCGIGLGCDRCGADADVPCDLTALGHQPAKLGTEEATPAPRRVTVRG